MMRSTIAMIVLVFCAGCDTNDPATPDESSLGRDMQELNQAIEQTGEVRVTEPPIYTSTQQRDSARAQADKAIHTEAEATDVSRAIVVLQSVGDNEVKGMVEFVTTEDGVLVRGKVSGLSEGLHGFHIHEFGDLSDAAKGESAGSHFNPSGEDHGHREDEVRHVGDFGNIEADAQGTATIEFVDKRIRFSGNESILGRAVVVHAGEDKFTQPAGDAGPRVAFGVIGVAKPMSE